MNTRELERKQAKFQVSLHEVAESLPEGLRRVLERKGVPDEGTGKYSIPNERVRIAQEKRR